MPYQNSVGLADLFGSVAQTLQNDQPYLNHLDSSNGNHGSNMVQNFQMIANVLRQTTGLDAQQQLDLAANAMESQGRGQTAQIYAEALRQAGQQMQGQSGITADQVVPFLTGLLNGTRSATSAQPGQGTMLDSLVPGIEGYLNARNQGMTNQQAIIHGLTSAVSGARQVQSQGIPNTGGMPGSTRPRVDPGASSAVSVLSGLFKQFSNL